MKDIDRRLAALGDSAPTPDLTGLESAVWAAIDAGDHTNASVRIALAFYILAAVTISGVGAGMATASSCLVCSVRTTARFAGRHRASPNRLEPGPGGSNSCD